jgi:SecD/SecF fusion protein
VGASIGREILLNAALAVGVSMLTILLYIAFRFEFGFGVGAMFSTLHDIMMTIGIFVLTGHKFSAPMVAAILCIAGYSINETVVVFDRIREELKINPTGSLRDIVNSAINKVFARTIMTSSTTFLAALSLYVFGSGVLRDISFTFLVGIVTSTFSAIFVAAQVFYWWHKGDRKHVEAHSDVAPKYEWTGASKASR